MTRILLMYLPHQEIKEDTMSANINDILQEIEGLSPEEMLKLSKKLKEKEGSVKEQQKIQTYLKVEKLLDDNNMTIEEYIRFDKHIKKLRGYKYSDTEGNYWSGKGRRPTWVVDIVGKDGDLDVLEWTDVSIQPLNDRIAKDKQAEDSTVSNNQDQTNLRF